MSYLLFLDESGHDHKNAPYEVRGGVALHAEKLWPFIQGVKKLEESCFGTALHLFGSEIKGHKLLDKDRFKWAAQEDPLNDLARRKHTLRFLDKGLQKLPPTRLEFTAYGQASLLMAEGLFQLLHGHHAKLFAVAIPRSIRKPASFQAEEYLRKDHVFLLERYFFFLEEKNQYGLLVMDETERNEDRRIVRRMERYFTSCQVGRYRSSRIVPSPFFVSSDMAYPVQAADVCIYCINHAFRIPAWGMNAATRPEIVRCSLNWLLGLQYEGDGYRDGQVFHQYGITYVNNPYGAGHA